jgi:protein ImuB
MPPALWACIRLPALAVEVFARAWSLAEQARPFVVTSGGHHPRVVAMNAAAAHAGIREGQLISAALALAPAMAMRERDEAAEAEALAGIADALLAFTPMACLAAPDAVLAEVHGSVRLFGGLQRLLARIEAAVHERGHARELGVAPTPQAALLLARKGHPPVLSRAALPAALADVPLAHAGLAPDAVDLLAAAGITSFGRMAQLPRAGLARRCGAGVVTLVDRTLGRIPDARAPYVPPACFAARLPLPALVEDIEALGFGVQRLVQQLAGWLEGRGLGVVRLALTLVHERHMRARGTPSTTVAFALGAPARDATHLLAVLRERLVRVALPAPVEAIALATEETAPLAGRNLGLLPGDESRDVPVPLFERLRARLGDAAVALLAPLADHRPELAQREAALTPAAACAGTQAPRGPSA